jgi:hypothetical protein
VSHDCRIDASLPSQDVLDAKSNFLIDAESI